jgi:peptidoglycan-associated lipoprotein
MRTHVLVCLIALVGLAGVATPVAAQEATAEVRTWSGESWRLTQPSLEVFFTIVEKGKARGGVPEGMESIESAVDTDILERTAAREAEAPEPKQGHTRKEVVTFFREGVEMQIPFARIKSLQFFRHPVEKSPFPPYLAATHFRHFATAELVDGSRVEADYVNLGTTVLRGMTPQGRVDIPWQDIENVRFESAWGPQPSVEEQRVTLASTVTQHPRPAPKAPAPLKRQITPLKEVPKVPQPTIEEERVARPSGLAEPPAPRPKAPAPLKRQITPLKEAPKVSQPTVEEERVARRSALTEPPVPIPEAPEPVKRDVVFDFNSLLLNDDAKVVLSAFGKWLKANPDTKIVMQGHCDERERGTNAYNLAIGELRIKAIRDHLVDAGIDGHRISTASDDEERSVVPPNDKSVWKCNRRVYLQVVQVEGPTR